MEEAQRLNAEILYIDQNVHVCSLMTSAITCFVTCFFFFFLSFFYFLFFYSSFWIISFYLPVLACLESVALLTMFDKSSHY